MTELYNLYKGKKVVITGASGFIGSYLMKILTINGVDTIGLIRRSSDLWRFNSIEDDFKLIELDLENYDRVNEFLKSEKPNYIFHFAIPPHSELNGDDGLQRQTLASGLHLTNLFKSIASNRLNTEFIHACSGAIYGWDPEAYKLNEGTEIKPDTLRGKLKSNQRNLCFELSNKYEVKLKLARVFRAYGPWEVNSKLIVKALESYKRKTPILLGSDQYKRDYIFVGDLVDGILRLGISDLESGTEINFGGTKQYSPIEIINTLEKLLKDQIPKELNAYSKNKYDLGEIVADCTLAKKLLGWQPKVSIKEGLKETIDWYFKSERSGN